MSIKTICTDLMNLKELQENKLGKYSKLYQV